MPGIYVLKCNRCDFSVGPHSMSVTIAIKDDGTEVICPHPLELQIAEGATGKSWRDLMKQGRLRCRYGLVCLGCGRFGHYGPDQIRAPQVGITHLGSIVHQPSSKEAGQYACHSCGVKALHPICGDTGCLLGLLNLVGLFQKRVACPKCKNGTLNSEMVGIS